MVTRGVIRLDVSKHTEFSLLSILDGMVRQENYLYSHTN